MFSQSLPRREFALSVQTRAKTPATISPNYLLGESRAGHPHPMYYDCGRLQPIRSVLIHGMCLFKNEFRTQKLTRTISDGTYTRNLHIRRRISSRNGGEPWSAELSSHTSSFCFNHNKLQLFALALCAPLPTRQKTSLSSLIYKHKFACFCRAGALVCVVQATAPCCCVAGAQSAVARLSADLYCKHPVCRSLLATN